MPKLPVFQAEGSVTQLGGTTANVQVPLNQNLASALKPVTDFVVKQKVQEKNFENKTEALKLENNFITDMAKVYDEVNVLENKDQAQLILEEATFAIIKGQIARNQASLAQLQTIASTGSSLLSMNLDRDWETFTSS